MPTSGPLADARHRKAREALADLLRRRIAGETVELAAIDAAVARLEQVRAPLGVTGLLDEGLMTLATRRKPLSAAERAWH